MRLTGRFRNRCGEASDGGECDRFPQREGTILNLHRGRLHTSAPVFPWPVPLRTSALPSLEWGLSPHWATIRKTIGAIFWPAIVVSEGLPISIPPRFTCKIGGEVDWDPARVMDAKTARRNDRYTQFAVYAARQAVQKRAVGYEQGRSLPGGCICRIGHRRHVHHRKPIPDLAYPWTPSGFPLHDSHAHRQHGLWGGRH